MAAQKLTLPIAQAVDHKTRVNTTFVEVLVPRSHRSRTSLRINYATRRTPVSAKRITVVVIGLATER